MHQYQLTKIVDRLICVLVSNTQQKMIFNGSESENYGPELRKSN